MEQETSHSHLILGHWEKLTKHDRVYRVNPCRAPSAAAPEQLRRAQPSATQLLQRLYYKEINSIKGEGFLWSGRQHLCLNMGLLPHRPLGALMPDYLLSTELSLPILQEFHLPLLPHSTLVITTCQTTTTPSLSNRYNSLLRTRLGSFYFGFQSSWSFLSVFIGVYYLFS